ncbi:MAG: recombinase family protein [Candidatus Gastranaerophilales bacterium]|nr:recombinase family protein [Candidatus Gastranaerophilales bacterium]
MNNTTYGYVRVSTHHQNIERQITNIHNVCEDAIIISDKTTGTKIDRPGWNQLMKVVKSGDRIIFDEVSRMSRNEKEGFEAYEMLYNKNIILEFIKEPYLNTAVYSEVAQAPETGDKDIDETIIKGLNEYLMRLAHKQIQIAFSQAEAEVERLHKRIEEGMKASGATSIKDAEGNVIMQGKISKAKTGIKLTTKKSITAKEQIAKYLKSDKKLTAREIMKLVGVAKNTYYKYVAELKEAGEI